MPAHEDEGCWDDLIRSADRGSTLPLVRTVAWYVSSFPSGEMPSKSAELVVLTALRRGGDDMVLHIVVSDPGKQEER